MSHSDARWQEIKLTQDLMDLFMSYQTPLRSLDSICDEDPQRLALLRRIRR